MSSCAPHVASYEGRPIIGHFALGIVVLVYLSVLFELTPWSGPRLQQATVMLKNGRTSDVLPALVLADAEISLLADASIVQAAMGLGCEREVSDPAQLDQIRNKVSFPLEIGRTERIDPLPAGASTA